MTAAPDVPEYRLYTSAQAGKRAGISGRTFSRLARERSVQHTRNGRLVFWTDEQIRDAVAYLATNAEKSPSSSRGEGGSSRPHDSHRGTARSGHAEQKSTVVTLVAKPGRRYRADAFG
ncbi:hypothetical protein [Nonomuraea sediminis]|uniref:hypothetical protein n=1 Tax=Nonomuraea sediminis TaxID=2835864 RepID=UPI001BDCD77C|nr:hypothetical protein [Nonomuraea sediminis]